MSCEEKEKYTVTYRYSGTKTLAVDWNKIPSDIFSKIPGKYIYNVMSATKDGKITEKTVVYIKPVKKFKKSQVSHDLDVIQLGV